MQHSQRGGHRRQRQTERALRVNRMRKLAFDTVGDERVHVAGCVQPAVREVRVRDASVPNELAEVRFDACGLRKADEMRDYGHGAIVLARHGVVGRVGLEPTTNGLRGIEPGEPATPETTKATD
jgi:hypothetical protein